MGLRARLTITFLLMAWLPLGGATWMLTRHSMEDHEASFAARARVMTLAVESRLSTMAAEIDEALRRAASDPRLEAGLIQPLARGHFYGDQVLERELLAEAERLVPAADIDTLRIVDLEEGGRVLAMGHRRGEEPDDPEAVRLARDHPGERVLRYDRLEDPDTGGTRKVWTLQVARPAGSRVALVGGRLVDRSLLADLLGGVAKGVEVNLEDAQGQQIAGTFEGAGPPAAGAPYDVKGVTLRNPGSKKAVGLLEIHVSRRDLEGRIGRLLELAGWLAGLSALLALAVGVWISRRISTPLERLAVAASDVAAGAREHQVPALRGRDEVARLTQAFNRMTTDLRDSEERLRHSERIAAWQEIARRIAHEIKNPLFPIQTCIETLEKAHARGHEDFEAILGESTRTILEEVARMKRIVEEFRDFARMPPLAPRSTNLSLLVRDMVALHGDATGEVELRAAGPDEVEVTVDPDKIRQVVTNLVQNSVQAHQSGSQVETPWVEVRVQVARDGGAMVVVADNGPGLSDEAQDRLFTPYFTTRPGGTGLGLAIVHRIVTEHGGTIHVESSREAGTRFTIVLPP